jgi:hypothetical protein
MTSLVARRARRLSLLAVASVAALVWHGHQTRTWESPARITGWVLAGLVVFLALYNARKKIAIVPLGSSAAWLQWHVYLGLFAILVFTLHAGLHVPNGTLETILAALFLLVALSGVGGLYVSRRIPPRLARRGEEVIYERVPGLIRLVAERAQTLALDSVSRTRSRAIADFHASELRAYLAAPCDRFEHLFGWGSAGRRREHRMAEFRSCLGPVEAPVFDELVALVRQKADIDYHWANQGLLKHWFFVHVPLTHALLLFILAHAILVYAFGGGR